VTSPADPIPPTPAPEPEPANQARTFRQALARAASRDARYDWNAYLFLFEAMEYTKVRRDQARLREVRGGQIATTSDDPYVHHLTGRELSEGARDLALTRYGPLGAMILAGWGVHSTSDLGNIVYNLIACGDLEKTPNDSREDFDDVFDFAEAFAFTGLIGEDETDV
jgi:uncharacterized repeat protein (TIGR04138 family)